MGKAPAESFRPGGRNRLHGQSGLDEVGGRPRLLRFAARYCLRQQFPHLAVVALGMLLGLSAYHLTDRDPDTDAGLQAEPAHEKARDSLLDRSKLATRAEG